jgi:HAD superfamily phosphoserine phosphatase-like hydrolase
MTLVASDLEGTLSAGEMWRAIGSYLKTRGHARAYGAFFRRQIPGLFAAKLGLIDSQGFKNNWFVGLSTFFRGWTSVQMDALAQFVVDDNLWQQRRTHVIDALLAHAQQGARVALVTGGYEPIVERFASKLRAAGIADLVCFSTPLRIDSGVYTGELAGEVCTGHVKVARLRDAVAQGELIAAYGDTYADIPMLALAKRGIAVSPDKGLAAEAVRRGWDVL